MPTATSGEPDVNEPGSYVEGEVIEQNAAVIPHSLPGAEVDRSRTVATVIASMNDLKLIRTFVANELEEGKEPGEGDYGLIPGAGKKKNLFLPGAQKINAFFNARPVYHIERVELGAGHVEFIITTDLISRATGLPISSGLGSCSSMETKYRYRSSRRTCPECGKEAIIVGKAEYGGGYLCFKKKGGCGAKFKTGDPQIEQQEEGQVENDNIYDIRNTILKMGKKRSYVDASIALGCLSELFTQDLEDIFDVGGPAAKPEVKPEAPAGQKEPPKGAATKQDKPVAAPKAAAPAPASSEGAGAPNSDSAPLMANAVLGGHGARFTARGVDLVKVTKKERLVDDGEGHLVQKLDAKKQPVFDYVVHTSNGERITTFSRTDAGTLDKAAREGRSVDLALKAVHKGEHWYLNLDEILGVA